MRQLLLLRHAKSAWDDPALPDHARGLSPKGRRAAAQMRAAIHSLGLVPDVVLVSTARRTMQTLEAIEPWDEMPIIEPLDRLYLASAAQLLGVLHGVASTVRSLMLVGHNPGLHELAIALARGHCVSSNRHEAEGMLRRLAEGFPAGALAEFTIASEWRDLGEGGGRLVRFLCPRDLPEMAS